MKRGIINHSDAIKHMFAGKCTITFHNENSNNWFTYKIVKSKKDDSFYLYVLTGSDIYTYFGKILNDKYYHCYKNNISDSAPSVKTFHYVFCRLIMGNLQDFIKIYHEGRCCKCGQKLTTPESVKKGIGPFCEKMIFKK